MQKVSQSLDIQIKKDFFIKSRKQNILDYYDLNPNKLGQGAYGKVYRATLKQPPHSVRVAKQISKRLVKTPQILQNQVAIMRRLDHPMIIRLYQSFQDQKDVYLVQDYFEGGDLFDRLSAHGSYNQTDARYIFTQIIKCLKYMHSERVCHRDIKLQNFMMNQKNTLDMKIIDYGLSFEWKEDMRSQLKAQKKNLATGSLNYMAPEVLKCDYDQRCDIWSAGVILYILVQGVFPFYGKYETAIKQKICAIDYHITAKAMQVLSPEIKDLIKRIFVQADKRISIDEILDHPWMINKLPQIPLQLDFKQLKNFSNFTKFKALAVTYIATQLPQKQIHGLGQIFKQIDTNNDGYITVEQLNTALSKQQQQTNYSQLSDIVDHIDTDRNGKINYSEFLACCLQTSYLQNQSYLMFIFKGIDRDGSGKISKDQIRKIFQQTQHQILKPSDVDQLIKSCDKNGDGDIDYNQFIQGMGANK